LRPNRAKKRKWKSFSNRRKPLAEREAATISWYAIKMPAGKYGIFDTFADENGRNAHLNGEIAKALFAKAKELFAKLPEIAKPEILASKSNR
jgi:quinol monooxygenase YgiN